MLVLLLLIILVISVMNSFDVFVYGTLCKGVVNHFYLENSMCLLSDVWISGYCLYDYQHSYPFMLKAADDAYVKGEVYRLDAKKMEELNILEDVENKLYRLVYLEENNFYTYLKYDDDLTGLNKITGGDWLKYIHNIC